MADLLPGAPYNQQVTNCCRGGVVSSTTQSNLTSTAAFQMVVGEFAAAKGGGGAEPEMPWGFDIGVPGYSCSNATKVPRPGPRSIANATSKCSVSPPVSAPAKAPQRRHNASGKANSCRDRSPYIPDRGAIHVHLPDPCSHSFSGGEPGPRALPAAGDGEEVAPLVRCSEHMCPIRVHWHVKVNYRKYWRVKVTVSNYNLVKNYSDWNLVLQHPNLRSVTQLFSFNYKPLVEYGTVNDTGMFWGIRYYNEMLLQDGNVQTEMILEKDQSDFTFSGGWAFPRREVIWDTRGAEATEQGDCSRVLGATRPHCCLKRPVMADLLPGAPYNQQVTNCCRGGVVSSTTQSNLTSTAAFQMVVGEFAAAKGGGGAEPEMPWGFDIGVPGYSCSNATKVPPTRTKVDSQRYVQVLSAPAKAPQRRHNASGKANSCRDRSPYIPDRGAIHVHLPDPCSHSFSGGEPGPRALPAAGDGEEVAPLVRCSEHMCPIRVHWHVKVNYRKYWRVKVTVSNYNLVKNYSDWNLVLQHPNLRSVTQLFSFNYKPLVEYGTVNDTGMFWGIRYYNEMLLQDGNVQTEMILEKDQSDFTFSGGWAFPRRIPLFPSSTIRLLVESLTVQLLRLSWNNA
ncbi:hypothetical protein HU200_032691 [Digitaria exilis]|uniref:COBRA C-terminal domain-containing protein n=1 Tax=Digitaria exilis TaxID=1010633 RepID=A0A835EQD8_9POAL|nr:hypothetical protein HU200_032691 [Digitaria exilis]